jgi:hypothetical protein
MRKHNYPLQIAYVYNNTVYTTGRGIYFGTRAMVDDAVIGNLVFASKPISGTIMRQSNNLVDSLENAPMYVHAPSFEIGAMDFYPLPGRCQGATVDLPVSNRRGLHARFQRHVQGQPQRGCGFPRRLCR